MIKINYFDERELLVRREIETKAPKDTKVLPIAFISNIYISTTGRNRMYELGFVRFKSGMVKKYKF